MQKNNLKTDTLITLLNLENTISINRALSFAIGLNETILYQALLSKYIYYQRNDLLEDGWFYSTANDLYESTTFSAKVQRKITQKLVDLKLIENTVKGMPCRNYYKINLDIELIQKYILQGQDVINDLNSHKKPVNKVNRKIPPTVEPKGHNREKENPSHSCDQRAQQETEKSVSQLSPKGATEKRKIHLTVEPKGHNKLRPKGTTSCDQRAHKTKDIKLKKETKDNLSINQVGQSTQDLQNSVSDYDRLIEENAIRVESIIEYDILIERHPDQKEFIDSVVNILSEIMSTSSDTVKQGSNIYSVKEFVKRIKKLNCEMIEDVMEKFNNTHTAIKNPLAYLTAVLYKEPVTYAIDTANLLKNLQ